MKYIVNGLNQQMFMILRIILMPKKSINFEKIWNRKTESKILNNSKF
jgi:hypothetical protein